MSNPLKSMMSKVPVGNVMSPQGMLMSMLQQQNPQAYNQLQQIMNSGKSPQEVLNEMVPQLSPVQIEQAKQMASRLGIK